jgi:photosystem II stability/assembly factor-like uncharacterized protein
MRTSRRPSQLFLLLSLAMAIALVTPATAHATAGSKHGDPGDRHGVRHHQHLRLSWRQATLDADQNFRGLDGVDARVAWVSGESLSGGPGKVYRTADGGRHWREVGPPDTTGLSFRDVEATGARTALVLAIGTGEAARIYRTTDGGTTWTETFENTDPNAFYDCMDFYPGNRIGLALSDPVGGKFRILRTTDAGRTWKVLPDAGMPDSTGEGGFAASGDCLTISGHTAYIGSGGAKARIYRSTDLGRHWTVRSSTIPAGPAAGVFAIAMRNPHHGIAVGGDFADPDNGENASAYLSRHGRWRNGGDLPLVGEDVAWWGRIAIAVGQYGGAEGSSLSLDGGRRWHSFSDDGWHAVDCSRRSGCWAAGAGGTVGRLVTR